MCLFFSSKSIVSMVQKKQDTEDTIKKRVFFNEANFVKAPKGEYKLHVNF